MIVKYPLEKNIGIADEIRSMLDAGQKEAAAYHWKAYETARALLKGVTLSEDAAKSVAVDDTAVLAEEAKIAAEALVVKKV